MKILSKIKDFSEEEQMGSSNPKGLKLCYAVDSAEYYDLLSELNSLPTRKLQKTVADINDLKIVTNNGVQVQIVVVEEVKPNPLEFDNFKVYYE